MKFLRLFFLMSVFTPLILSLHMTYLVNAHAEHIGSVDTVFRMFSRDDDIVIEAFDDPDILGVTCYLSRARKGGVSGMVGVAEDPAYASIQCLKTGPLVIDDDILSGKRNGERVFKERTSLLFKTMQVVRFYDRRRGVLVYLVFSDKIVQGSPQNSLSCINVD